ncbi:hypothetical protein ACS0PU_011188 [Formica fusca]
MRSLARRLLVWPAFVLSLLVAGRLLFGRDFRLPTTTIVFHDDDSIPIPSGGHTNSQQDSGPPGPPAYAAGMYMTGRQPRNGSACKWYHGLPDVLSYPPSKLTWSPEIGEKSPYRVLPFVLRGATEATDGLPQVTLSTHATADQVYGIVELARRWRDRSAWQCSRQASTPASLSLSLIGPVGASLPCTRFPSTWCFRRVDRPL